MFEELQTGEKIPDAPRQPRTCSHPIYARTLLEGNEDRGGNPQAYGNLISDIPRRSLNTDSREGRADSACSFNFPTVQSPRTCQSDKVCANSTSENGILRVLEILEDFSTLLPAQEYLVMIQSEQDFIMSQGVPTMVSSMANLWESFVPQGISPQAVNLILASGRS